MDRIVIEGGVPLIGDVQISGAKNAALPLMVATLLTDEPVVLQGVPHLNDISTLANLLTHHGTQVSFDGFSQAGYDGRIIELTTKTIVSDKAPYDLVRKMRASVLVLGPLLARYGKAKVSLPGGCAIGTRPVMLHVDSLKALGADITIEDGYICAKAPLGGLQGGDFTFPLNTVGGTTAFIFGAVLAKGVSNLHNAAIEPEIVDLCHMLCAMGAKISGIGTRDLVIEGVSSLTGVTHNILPDRIELGTYLVAAAMTKGHLTCHNADTALLPGFEALFTGIGCPLKIGDNQIALDARDCELSGFSVQTDPYPGFPTDLQAQFMALACVVNGESVIEERIFENRFMHVPELIRLGANIRIDHSTAHIKGVKSLSGAEVMATDLRASVAMVLAGLAALGTTTINRVYHIDRGYEHVEEKLLRCGARIKRLPG